MRRSIVPVHRRRTGGRRKSRARVGLAPILLFVALCVATAAAGIMIERKLQSLTPAPSVHRQVTRPPHG